MDFATTAPLPMGPFRCILADPAWRVEMYSEKGMGKSPERHYETMTLAEIKAMPVQDVAADDCVLLMWVVDPVLDQAFEVARCWGFTYKTVGFYWVKVTVLGLLAGVLKGLSLDQLFPMGTGYWTRANPEQCLLFTRGKPPRLSRSVRKLIVAPRREHSRKPEEQYGRIEALVAGPRLELFARQDRPGWTSWGDQSGTFATAAC